MRTSRQIVLRSRPRGAPVVEDFALERVPVPALEAGEFLLRNLMISLDPGIRQRLSLIDSYVRLIDLNAPLTSATLGVVADSRDPRVAVGDHLVAGLCAEIIKYLDVEAVTRDPLAV